MTFIKDTLSKLFKEDEGQGMTEYALIVVLISVALIAGLIVFRDELAVMFTDATSAVANR